MDGVSEREYNFGRWGGCSFEYESDCVECACILRTEVNLILFAFETGSLGGPYLAN